MNSCVVIKGGLYTTLQDNGRSGRSYYAIPSGGVMDSRSATIAALVMGMDNPVLIECTGFPPSLQFSQRTTFVLTGANFDWKVDDSSVVLNQKITVTAGSILSGKPAKEMFRGYIAIEGIIQADYFLDSHATDTLLHKGGFQGRNLKSGDIIYWLDWCNPGTEFVVNPGPEAINLSAESIELLSSSEYSIDSASDRMGTRLNGPPLTCSPTHLGESVVVTPGMMLLPPDGQPIIVQKNGQTTGGYPRIGWIDDLDRLNQMPLGRNVKFKWNSPTDLIL